jgi:hypothetical protein
MADEPLRLAASLEEDRLTFQANDSPPVVFQDVFPLRRADSGVFSLFWPSEVRLEQLHASHRKPASEPSLLERGDDKYAEGRLREALDDYQNQARTAATPQARQEARCKAAICLLELKRADEAAAELQTLKDEPDPRWAAVAAFQLWRIRLRQDNFKDASDILAALTTRYHFEELVPTISQEVRQEILQAYERHSRCRLFRIQPEPVSDLRNLLLVQEFFNTPRATRWQTKFCLVEAYHEADRPEDTGAGNRRQALQLAGELLREPLPVWLRTWVLNQYAWLLLRSGDPQAALDEVDRWLIAPGGGPVQEFLPLFLERARIHWALERWGEADKDLDTFFERAAETSSGWVGEAWLLRGFLRQRRRDEAGATAAWREGFLRARHDDLLCSVYGVMLGSLSNEVTEADVVKILDESVGRALGPGFYPGEALLKNYKFSRDELLPVYRQMYRSRRGLEWARKIAFRECSYAEVNSIPVLLYAAEVLHQGAFPGELTPEHDALIWQLVQDVYPAFTAGTFKGQATEPLLLEFLLTWEDADFGVSWPLLAAVLDPPVRGPLAYVLGHRYLVLKKPARAAVFFNTAREDAPADSVLRRLAQAEIERMKMK